jgi:hypothetical protein
MAVLIMKIVNNFDNKWVRVFFHQPDLLQHCLLLALVQELNRILRPFDSKLFLIMLPDGFENMGEATLSDKVILVRLIEVGVFALLGTAIYLRSYELLPFYHILRNYK